MADADKSLFERLTGWWLWAVICFVVIPALEAAISTLVGGFSHTLLVWTVGLGAASIICAALAAFFDMKVLKALSIGLVVLFAMFLGAALFEDQSTGPTLHVTRGASMVVTAKGRGSLQVLYDKTFTTPIDLFIWFQVDNTQSSTPATVSAYTLEAAPGLDGPWTELCPVPLDKSVLLMETPTPNIAWTTDLRGSMLEKTLLNQSLPPHAVVSGWTAWICPHPDCIGGGDVFRLKTFDASGVTIASIAEPLVGHLITTGSQLQINGSVNTARFVSQPWDCH